MARIPRGFDGGGRYMKPGAPLPRPLAPSPAPTAVGFHAPLPTEDSVLLREMQDFMAACRTTRRPIRGASGSWLADMRVRRHEVRGDPVLTLRVAGRHNRWVEFDVHGEGPGRYLVVAAHSGGSYVVSSLREAYLWVLTNGHRLLPSPN